MQEQDICKDWIRIQDLDVRFGSSHALKAINFDIPTKHLTSIIGPSGCGKSTLLRCLNRFIDFEPDAQIGGRIDMGGVNVLSPSVDVINLRKHIGMLSQRPSPLPMSIFDNVAYGPRLYGMRDMGQLTELVRSKLQMADLWEEVKDRLDSAAGVLSIGQQQRLCLARTLSVEPRIILADEPTSALDPIACEHIEALLLRLKKEYTIVLATHNIHQARKVSDYVAHLYYGELVESGWARELFDMPKHPRTHAYIHGHSYVEHAIDSTLTLASGSASGHFMTVKRELAKLGPTQVLQVLCDERARAGHISQGLEADGHTILRIRKVSKNRWELVVRK